MGTKSAARNEHERHKLKNNETDSLKEVSANEGFSPSNDKKKNKTKSRVAEGNNNETSAAEIEAEACVNNQEIEKDKKKKKEKKRKPEQRNSNVKSCEVEKQDMIIGNGGEVTETEKEKDLKADKTGVEVKRKKKKNHSNKNIGEIIESSSSGTVDLKNNSRESVDEGKTVSGRGDVSKTGKVESGDRKMKKNKQQKIHEDGGHVHVVASINYSKEDESERFNHDTNIMDDVESPKKERKKKKRRSSVDLVTTSPKVVADVLGNERYAVGKDGTSMDTVGNEPVEEELGANVLKKEKKKRKKRKREHGMGGDVDATNSSEKPTPPGTSKRVSFAEKVEVFPSSNDPSDKGTVPEEELVRGKRFSPEEDEMVKEAVLNYIDSHGLGEDGLKMLLECKKHRELRNCWREIGLALPWRPHESVYYRAHILFERSESRSWTEEELEIVRKYHEKFGADWKTLATALGKHRFHVKDAWRRVKLTNRNRGQWSQEEYQTLFELVNMDLRMRAVEEVKKTKHGMLRDNICWTAISDKLGTRTTPMCCIKWYDQLTSPMVAEGKWADVDDYRLLIALYQLDACCMEDVDWDSLLEHRSGDISRKRWNQMAKHLGEHGNKSFADLVEILMDRYCPDVLEAREAYDSKPVVT